MRSFATEAILPRIFPAILALAMLPGCGNDSSGPGPEDPVLTVWIGTYSQSGGDDWGALMIDITRSGDRASAELVIESRRQEEPELHLFLEGSARGDEIILSLDYDEIPYTFDFDVHLTVGPGGTSTGTLYYSVLDMTAEFECSEAGWAYAEVDTAFDVNYAVLGLARDSEHFWLSTFGKDYVLMDSATALVDTITVMYDGMHWTSDALTSDGDLLWGHIPLSVEEGGVVSSESYCIEFTGAGDITRMFRVRHRISGLAWDGQGLWSLSTRSDSLYSLDMDGYVVGSAPVGVPDLSDIEFGGGDFWAVGWYMRRVYRIGADGDVLRVYRFPEGYSVGIPGGLVLYGSDLWCVFSQGFQNSRIYRLALD